MSDDVLVVGAGLGGLAAAIDLAARGLSVRVIEAQDTPGGKANVAIADGVEVDTGPSVVTLLDVWRDLMRHAGTRLEDEVDIMHLTPATRYVWPDGCVLDVHEGPEQTIEEVRRVLGRSAADEMQGFLAYAKRIWDAAAPPFVLGAAPTPGHLLRILPSHWQSLFHIDPMRSMDRALFAQVRDPKLRDLLRRFATYNGSDPRRAPATLHCIAHVELGLGVYGVRGGIHAMIRALVRIAELHGVTFQLGEPVREILWSGGEVTGVRTDHNTWSAPQVVVNADVSHLVHDLLPPTQQTGLPRDISPSMSGWVGIAKARRRAPEARAAHTVLFPEEYTDEFSDIFDAGTPPREPTIYQCAQERAHGRLGWQDHEPVFLMANTPPEPRDHATPDDVWNTLREKVVSRLVASELLDPDDRIVWERSPAGLEAAYPRTRGAIYGAASNDMFAAFRRPANRVSGARGLYVASGSAHPGGGMPLCVLSGRAAAAAALSDRER